MEEIRDLEVEVLDDFIWEVTLEQMAEFAMDSGVKAIPYEKTEKGNMLIGILLRSSDRMWDMDLIARSLIVNTIYCFVEDYRRLLVYDPIHRIIRYTNNNNEHRYESTHVWAITTYPHFLYKIASKAIVEKLEDRKMQGAL